MTSENSLIANGAKNMWLPATIKVVKGASQELKKQFLGLKETALGPFFLVLKVFYTAQCDSAMIQNLFL